MYVGMLKTAAGSLDAAMLGKLLDSARYARRHAEGPYLRALDDLREAQGNYRMQAYGSGRPPRGSALRGLRHAVGNYKPVADDYHGARRSVEYLESLLSGEA